MAQFPSENTAYGIWSLNEIRDARRGNNWPEIPITAAVVSSIGAVDEGNAVTFTVTTEGASDGETLYYNISGSDITASDFTDSTLSDSFTVTNNSASITKTLSADDTTEGLEVMTFEVRVNSTTGLILASTDVNINDTSTTPVPSQALIPLFSTWSSLSQNATSTLSSGTLYESSLDGYVGNYYRDAAFVVDNSGVTIDLNNAQLNYLDMEDGGGNIYSCFGFSAVAADNFTLRNGYVKIQGSDGGSIFETSYNRGYGGADGVIENLTVDITQANLGSLIYSNGGDVVFNNVYIIYDTVDNYSDRIGTVNRGSMTGYTLVQKDTSQGQSLLASFPY